MVVTPGVDRVTSTDDLFKETKDEEKGENEDMIIDSERGATLGSFTSQGSNVATHVMAWEDPFKDSINVSYMFISFFFMMFFFSFPTSLLICRTLSLC